jgi:hypothetical protein
MHVRAHDRRSRMYLRQLMRPRFTREQLGEQGSVVQQRLAHVFGAGAPLMRLAVEIGVLEG